MADYWVPPDGRDWTAMTRDCDGFYGFPNSAGTSTLRTEIQAAGTSYLKVTQDQWDDLTNTFNANEKSNAVTTEPVGAADQTTEIDTLFKARRQGVLLVGDSIINTVNQASTINDRMHSRVLAGLGGAGAENNLSLNSHNRDYHVWNIAVGSSQLVHSSDADLDWSTLAATKINNINWPQTPGGNRRKILVIKLGTNDIANDGQDGETLWADRAEPLLAGILTAQSDIEVIWCTEIARLNEATTAKIAAYNADIRAMAVSDGAVSVCDLGALPEFLDSDWTVVNNTTNYAGDKVHQTDVGINLIAEAIVASAKLRIG